MVEEVVDSFMSLPGDAFILESGVYQSLWVQRLLFFGETQVAMIRGTQGSTQRVPPQRAGSSSVCCPCHVVTAPDEGREVGKRGNGGGSDMVSVFRWPEDTSHY